MTYPEDKSQHQVGLVQWLLARSIDDGKGNPNLPDEETQKVKESIDEWRKKEVDGTFVPKRRDDVLSRAIGKQDHNGRAIAFGGGVGIKAVWGTGEWHSARRGGDFEDDELEELEARVAQRVREETIQEMNTKIDAMVQKEKFVRFAKQLSFQIPSQMMEVDAISPFTPHNLRSCYSGGLNLNSFVDIQEPVPCRLLLMISDSEKVVVAEGTLHPELTLDHHKGLIPDHVRVSLMIMMISLRSSGTNPIFWPL